MATYVVGDLQGCLHPLKKLLKRVKFSKEDKLWCVGDIVNRGPESLATVEFLMQLGDRCQIVLGNHDLHLLAVYFAQREIKSSDTISSILSAPNLTEIIDWFTNQPIVYHQDGYTMVHAGIYPTWSIEQAIKLGQEVSKTIKQNPKEYFNHMYGNTPDYWDNHLLGYDRLRFITNACTRMRYCFQNGRLDLKNKSAPIDNHSATQPWFAIRHQQFKGDKILFGHWAALAGQCPLPDYHALDTGFVWGGELTLLRLDDLTSFSIKA